MIRVLELRIRYVGASLGMAVMLLSVSAPAWSQTDERFALSSSLTHRFESGEFGEPMEEVRRQSTIQAAMENARRPQYVYYVVSCDTPGAIRAGSPSTLDPSRSNAGRSESTDVTPSGDATWDDSICVVLVDENRNERAPLLYSYDSSYRYPDGYPSHYRYGSNSRTYAGSISVGYSSSRRYGFGHHGHYPFGVSHYGAFPYGIGHYAGHFHGLDYGYPYGLFPYRNYPYTSPYVSHHYGFGIGVSHYATWHYGSRRYHIPHGRLGR